MYVHCVTPGDWKFPCEYFLQKSVQNHLFIWKNEDSYICQDSNSKPSHTVSIKTLYCTKHKRLSAYRCLSVSVGEDAMDLHFFFVHLVDIYPQVLAHWIWWPVCFWCVVVVICVLLQEKKKNVYWHDYSLPILILDILDWMVCPERWDSGPGCFVVTSLSYSVAHFMNTSIAHFSVDWVFVVFSVLPQNLDLLHIQKRYGNLTWYNVGPLRVRSVV